MPSAANVKIDKQIPSEIAINDTSANSTTPLRQAITTIEHKIRNLEKRKAKLESYRELQNSGKDLNHDQKTAVAKYDEVVQTLEFARDLCKQFLGIANSSEKEAKKQARKEALARSQAELAKVREVLLVQDALTQMGQDNIRDDFLNGRNGAASLNESDLKLLDDLYTAVTPKHEPGDSQIFCSQVQAAAEHLLAVVDGKPKDAFGGTYSQIKDIIGKIHESGYFDQQAQEPVYETVEPELAPEIPIPEVLNHESIPPVEVMPPIESLSIETLTPVQPITSVQPVQTIEPTMEQIPPEQQIYYQQPPRPITEVLGAGSFYFLQDSELDTPPEQIPSQTFTNQSYVAGPPPPIPMPPHFQTYPPQTIPQPPPSGNGIEEHQDVQEESHKQRGRPRPSNQPFYANNNGYNNRSRQNRNNGPRPGNRHNQ